MLRLECFRRETGDITGIRLIGDGSRELDAEPAREAAREDARESK